MKFKNALSLLCVTGLMAMALAGCGSSSSDNTSAAGSSTSSGSSELSSSEIIGQVQSVNDKTITLLLGELTDAGQKGAPTESANSSGSTSSDSSADTVQQPANGQPGDEQPSGPAPSGESKADASTPTDNSGSSSAQSDPSANPPSGGQPGGGETFTAGTETVTITLTDDTSIQVESVSGETDGSIDDLKEGAILDVTLNEDNTVTAVIVKNVMTGNPAAAPDNTTADAPAADSSSSQSTNS